MLSSEEDTFPTSAGCWWSKKGMAACFDLSIWLDITRTNWFCYGKNGCAENVEKTLIYIIKAPMIKKKTPVNKAVSGDRFLEPWKCHLTCC